MGPVGVVVHAGAEERGVEVLFSLPSGGPLPAKPMI